MEFVEQKLKLPYATFNYRLRNGRLLLADYHAIFHATGLSFEELFPSPYATPRQLQRITLVDDKPLAEVVKASRPLPPGSRKVVKKNVIVSSPKPETPVPDQAPVKSEEPETDLPYQDIYDGLSLDQGTVPG
jgi:hypothetical protein